jgi:hypothetical protein
MMVARDQQPAGLWYRYHPVDLNETEPRNFIFVARILPSGGRTEEPELPTQLN